MKKRCVFLLISILALWSLCGAALAADRAEMGTVSEGWPELGTDLTHIICYGQSFSTGSDAPGYPDPIVDGSYVLGSVTSSKKGDALEPLQMTSGAQHPIVSAVNALAQMLAAEGIDTDLVAASYGAGGRTVAQLMSKERQEEIKAEEGYSYDCRSSGRYEVFCASVAALADYAANNGQSVSCPAIVYLQGETDQNTDAQLGYPDNPDRAGYGAGGDKETYKEYMTRLKEDMQREVMEAYGQSEKPLFLIYQVSGTYVRTDHSSINMAQLEFAQENEDVILLQTPYFTPHYTNSHHLTVNGYRWLGEYIAQYLFSALVEREKPWPMLPEEIACVGEDSIRIRLNRVENGLSIDTYTVENATNSANLYGMTVLLDEAKVRPESVTFVDDEIWLTLPESAPDLSAVEKICVQYGGRSARGSGNIRDNSDDCGFYDYLDDSGDIGINKNQGVSHSAQDASGNSIVGQRYPMYRWLASFCYEVDGRALHTHTYRETVIAPDCDREGYTVYACRCGDDYRTDVTEPTGVHRYKAQVTPPDCIRPGFTTYVCSCGSVGETTDAVEPLGHLEVVLPAVLPTAEQSGCTRGVRCGRCGAVLTAQQTVPATGYGQTLADGAFRVLLIGNTFAEDAANYGYKMPGSQLLDILQAYAGEGTEIAVGLAHASATSMAWHATQAESGEARYAFEYIDSVTGHWQSLGKLSSADALNWAEWDAVVLQPFSTEAIGGVSNPIHPEQENEKFYPLEASTAFLLDHVNRHAPQAEVYCFMHWQRTAKIAVNVSLGSHEKMAAFFPTVMTYWGTESGARYTDVIPVGTAVQNARTTYLSLLEYHTDSAVTAQEDPQFGLQRDVNHLSLNVGRYLAALTVAEIIFPEELRAEGCEAPDIRVTESVGKLPGEYSTIAQKAVWAAVESWKEEGSLGVTEIAGYETDPTHAAAAQVEGMAFALRCDTADGLESQLSEAVLEVLPEDFAVSEVTVDEETVTAEVTVRYGYTFRTVTVEWTKADHAHQAEVTPPACTEKGYTTYTCRCGESYKADYVNAKGHSFMGGVCGQCGAADPDHKPEVSKVSVRASVTVGAEVTFGTERKTSDGSVSFEARPGTYTLTAQKRGCLTYTVKDVKVEGADVDLGSIELLAGDVTGDEKINMQDLRVFLKNFNKTGDRIEDDLTDVTGDSKVNMQDLRIFLKNFNKTAAKDCTVNYSA